MEESIRVLRFRIFFDFLVGAGTMDSFEEGFAIIHLIGQLAKKKDLIIESCWGLFFIAKRQSFFSFFDQSAHLRKLLFNIKSSQILCCSAVSLHERMGEAHLNMLVRDFFKSQLGHFLDFAGRHRKRITIGKASDVKVFDWSKYPMTLKKKRHLV